MKKLAFLFVVLLMAAHANAASFSDSFDNTTVTSNFWDQMAGTWDHVVLNGLDLGYHGVVPGNSYAVSFANNQQYVSQANLLVETLIKLDGNETNREDRVAGLVFISGSLLQMNYVEYTVLLDINFDDQSAGSVRTLEVWSNSITPSGTTENLVGSLPVNISLDKFYRLNVSTDSQGNIDVLLYEAASNSYLGGLSDVHLVTPFSEMMVGIVAVNEATFNNFSITDNTDCNSSDCLSLLTQTQVSQLYVSIFGRASEGEGNGYWQLEQSDMTVAANTMLDTEPAKAYFGPTLNDNQKFIEFIYENTLGKTYSEDPDGVNYWVSELASGKSKGQVIATLINAAIDPQYAGLPAQDQFLNKVAVSNYVADHITAVPDVNDLSAFVNFISGVTDNAATVVAAKAAVDAF